MCADGLYHRSLGLPGGAVEIWGRRLALHYSQHARQEASADRYGKCPLYLEVDFEPGDVVEVEVVRGMAVKAVLRFPLDGDERDLVFVVLRPEREHCFVKTLWINRADDGHRTLDRTKYKRLEKGMNVR